MTHTQYRVTCDNCNRREYSEGDDTETDALLGAHRQGWRRRTVQNGGTWDFCPRCEALIKEERERDMRTAK